MKKIISPSLLSCDFLNIEKEISHFENIDSIWLHLDIMDGHFVPNLTFGPPIIKMISKKTKIPLDAHFMVTNPEFYIESCKDLGLHNFTFHIEATQSVEKYINLAKKYYPSVGISVRPKTPLENIPTSILKNIDLLLIMSVEPGFGGQSFIETTYEKISNAAELKKSTKGHFSIQVDGGINDQNAKKLFDAGADNLVAGSYVFKDGPSQYASKISKLLL